MLSWTVLHFIPSGIEGGATSGVSAPRLKAGTYFWRPAPLAQVFA